MNISRRGFAATLAAALAGAVLDPERLLWVPGQKTIFVPTGKVFVPDLPKIVGYSLTFGPDAGGWGLIGNLDHFGLKDVGALGDSRAVVAVAGHQLHGG